MKTIANGGEEQVILLGINQCHQPITTVVPLKYSNKNPNNKLDKFLPQSLYREHPRLYDLLTYSYGVINYNLKSN
jgi:hypothetical protein